jgi:hypothetical protein
MRGWRLGEQFWELVDGAEFLLEVADAVWTVSTGYSDQLVRWKAYNKAGLPVYSTLWLAFQNVSREESGVRIRQAREMAAIVNCLVCLSSAFAKMDG